LSKFVRQPLSDDSGSPSFGASPPKPPVGSSSRIYGNRVSVGAPVSIEGDPGFRDDLESSLTVLTQTRLLEAEAQAKALVEKMHRQAYDEMAELKEKAEAEAKQKVKQAQSEADGIREAAREDGFKAGFQEGYDEATAQVEQETVGLLQSAQLLVEGAHLAEKRVLKNFEKHAVTLVEHVVARILGDTLHEDDAPAKILHLIETGVENVYLTGKVKVVVSAQVLHDLRTFSRTSAEALDTMSRFEFVADPLLTAQQIYVIGQDARFDFTPTNQAKQLLAPVEKHLDLPRNLPEESPIENSLVSIPEEGAVAASPETPSVETLATETFPDEIVATEESEN
jgi:flagellar assembly protein FliH